jgi:hypothetical protein
MIKSENLNQLMRNTHIYSNRFKGAEPFSKSFNWFLLKRFEKLTGFQALAFTPER